MTTFLLPFGSWIYHNPEKDIFICGRKTVPSVFRLSSMRGNPPGSTTESTQPVPLLSYERSDRVDAVTFQTEAMRCERLMYHVATPSCTTIRLRRRRAGSAHPRVAEATYPAKPSVSVHG